MEYTIKEKIMEGKYSTIYLADSTELEVVCLKKISSTSKYFKHELDSLMKLKHDNAISMLDFYIFEDYNYFVLEYCNEGTLLDWKKSGNHYDINFFNKIISGLNYIHSLGIIHRDIKPENILVKNGIPKISDFGFAIKTDYAFTKIIGTVYYISPEVYSKKYYNYKTDIWALGCTLYYIITGRKLFDGDKKRKIIKDILKKNIIIDVPEEYKNLITGMLIRNINLRCISFEEKQISCNKPHNEIYKIVNSFEYNFIINHKEFYLNCDIDVNDILVVEFSGIVKICTVKSVKQENCPYPCEYFGEICNQVKLEFT